MSVSRQSQIIRRDAVTWHNSRSMVCYMCGKNNRIHLIFGPIEFVGVLWINSIIFEVESCEECNLFHQDSSAAPETQNSVVALRNTFADPIISPPLWPVRSLDLMKRDCYLRRRLKDSIYASNLHTHTHTHTQRERGQTKTNHQACSIDNF